MISIIIVNYSVKKELFACIKSIIDSKPKTSYEIIVVDNDEIKTIPHELKKKFTKVRYIENDNRGYGEGNNIGAAAAKGDYLFFLNPDTKVFPHTIDGLVEYLKKHKKVGIAAPLLYDGNNNLYPQGARELTPLSAIFSFSLVHSLFPENKIAQKYWLSDEWDKTTVKRVSSVPGAAFVIRRKVFELINGFDENFFMYFEEHDLCKRVREAGWGIVMYPPAKVYHALGRSSVQVKEMRRVFYKSRFYYFKKHFGLFTALLTEALMRISKYTFMLPGILLFAFFVSTYRIDEYLTFIGDQAWYYFSARDMLLQGVVPLVGIPSSHPWLHQGAFWTYMLVPGMWFFGFSPHSGAYLSVALHLLTVYILYKIVHRLFSQNAAIVAALLYASSPLILLHVRMPYHTTPIPLLSLLFYFSVFQWIKGYTYYFPISIFLLALLYNFEIATFLLTIVFLAIVLIGFLKQTIWIKSIFQKRILALSVVSFTIPMLPMLIYDIGHGFPQTLKFIAWVGYKILLVFGYPPINTPAVQSDYATVILFLAESYKKLSYLPDDLVAFTIGIFSIGFFGNQVIIQFIKKNYRPQYLILSLIIIISVIGIITTKTASDAYLTVLFPFIVVVNALFFTGVLVAKPSTKYVIIVIVAVVSLANVYQLTKENYLVTKNVHFTDKVAIAKKIISQTAGRSYNLQGRGIGSEHSSFTMSYEYILWWLGKAPSKAEQNLVFIVEETPAGIKLIKEDKKI